MSLGRWRFKSFCHRLNSDRLHTISASWTATSRMHPRSEYLPHGTISSILSFWYWQTSFSRWCPLSVTKQTLDTVCQFSRYVRFPFCESRTSIFPGIQFSHSCCIDKAVTIRIYSALYRILSTHQTEGTHTEVWWWKVWEYSLYRYQPSNHTQVTNLWQDSGWIQAWILFC
jgi:hypothetical protein